MDYTPDLFESLMPDYIRSILEEWNKIAVISYRGFIEEGRGVVGIVNDKIKGVTYVYMNKEHLLSLGRGFDRYLEEIEIYYPDNEIIIEFDDIENKSKVARIGTPEYGTNPKEIWFLDNLFKIAKDENIDNSASKLPDWFYRDALIFLDSHKEKINEDGLIFLDFFKEQFKKHYLKLVEGKNNEAEI